MLAICTSCTTFAAEAADSPSTTPGRHVDKILVTRTKIARPVRHITESATMFGEDIEEGLGYEPPGFYLVAGIDYRFGL